jgi:transposase
MRTKGTAAELQQRRELAVRRVKDGYRVTDVAALLDVDRSSINKWVRAER